MTNILNKAHLIYLGIIPSIVTIFILQKIDPGSSGLVFTLMLVFGTAIVGVYLAMIGGYRKDIVNPWVALLVILDGPIFGLLSIYGNQDFMQAIINTFLIENIAIWISIGILAVTAGIATKGQAIASVMLSVVLLAGLFGLYYTIGFFSQSPLSYIFVAAGAIEALVINYRVLKADNVVREYDDASGYILIYIILWVASLIIGGVVSGG